ncbi:MAG: hypothetical protein ACE5E1_11005, partial [Phycisphaerae bacterium]
GALALEESGDYTDAIRAYRRISADSPNHWSARRNIARCAQRRYEALPEKTSRAQRAALADEAVDAWLKLVDALSSLDGSKKTGAQKRRATPAPTPASNAEMRRRWMNEAKLAAAALLVSEDLRAYDRCRDLLAETPESARVLGLRIRCLQGLGRIEEANQAVEDFLKKGPAKELGSVLLGLAAEMEAEIKRLETAGRKAEARRMANETVPTLRYLLEWIRSRPDQRRHVPIVQFSLVRTLIQAGRARDAVRQLEALMEEDPNNGRYVRRAAILHEDLAAKAAGAQRVIELNRAESLWARLLKDPTLRTTAPARYWEARCHWYRHQLRHGRAAEVIRGIETEKAWQPDLGGAPWQGRLLELVEEARSALRESPPLESESSPIRTEAVS